MLRCLCLLTRLSCGLWRFSLWSRPSSIRELQLFPSRIDRSTPTVQTVVYRLEFKKAVRRASKVSNAHVFEAVVSRSSAQHRMIDDLVALFGGKPLPIMSHLIESGRLTPEEVKEAQKALRNLVKKEKS